MAITRTIEIPEELKPSQETTKALLARHFPECSVSSFGAYMKIRSDFRWGLAVRKNLINGVAILLIQEKTFGGKDKGPPHFQLAKNSPLGPWAMFVDDSLLDAVGKYLSDEYPADLRTTAQPQ